MIKLIPLLMLFLSLNSHAQKRLNSNVFQASVRPILVNILSDFYQMVAQFPDFPNELGTMVNHLNALTSDRDFLLKQCPRVLSQNCLENINSIRSRLSSLQTSNVRLLSNLKMGSALHLSSLSGLRSINEFQATLDEAKGLFDNASYMIKARVPYKKETMIMVKLLDQLQTYISLAVVEFVPFQYKEDFRHFYFNFVQPIQQQLSKNMNYEFLNRNINSLNFALNLLNMNLTKRNKKTPEGMASYLALLHNRWNSILRYYF